MDFCQEEYEKFYESWERFKDNLLKCLHHGFETWRLVQIFYDGLTQSNPNMIESMNGGSFLNLRDDTAYQFLENLSESSQQWDFSNPRYKQSNSSRKGGKYEVTEDFDVRAKLDSLTRKVEALTLSRTMESANQVQREVCSLCASSMHTTQTCPSMVGHSEYCAEQVNALNNYGKSFTNPFSETNNPNWRNQSNLPWRQNNSSSNVGGQPLQWQNQFPSSLRPSNQSYQTQNYFYHPQAPQSNFQPAAPQQQKSSLEDSLQEFMKMTRQAIVELKNQMGQLASQMVEIEKEKFPNQLIQNPKGQFDISNHSNSTYEHEQVQSIVTLRSGNQVDNQVSMPIENSLGEFEKEERQSPTEVQKSSLPQPPKEPERRSFIPKAPYPERLVAPKKGVDHGDILETFKQVRIKIPLLDAIRQVPSYAKFLKDLVSIKRKTSTPKEVLLTEHVSSIIQHKIPIKYKDPGCPTISCTIGNHHLERALLDLGASVNLLPYSVYQQLGLGELKPTTVRLQLADGSLKIPKGVIEDVLIKVDKFYFPADLIVLDTQPVHHSRGQIRVILGCPFLATSNAQINCRNGVMKMSFGNVTFELTIFDTGEKPLEEGVRKCCLYDK
ncbi:uncharacterized protein LOC131299654 [Rhododendron vialii]|uniref:uncharacterized protein LOC131299654 n=1 Tax=Rhododendron vialii TaxID=182163 RepID=UPI00265F67F3|nr:uncharacterized protein LOC131299654 [Rhododendron vialii]